MNSKRALYTKEVGVPLPKWTDLPPSLLRPPGRGIERTGPRAHRYLTDDVDDSRLMPAIQPYPKGSGFVRDEGELALRVGQARTLNARLLVSGHHWAHLEQDQSRKIVLQRGGPPGWFYVPDGLIRVDGPSMQDAFHILTDWMAAVPQLDAGPARYKMATTHGWPDYLRTNTSFLLHAFWAAGSSDFDDLTSFGMELAGILGETETPFSAAMFTRTGPLGKAVKGYSATAEGLVMDCELIGLCCRRRIVFGMPSAGNMWQLERVERMKTRLKQIPFFYHMGPADVAAKVAAVHRRRWHWFSDDISGYDQSVCDVHQRELSNTMIAKLISPEFARFKIQWKDIPLLGPGTKPQEEGFLYEKKGMTPSGDLMTAFDGTMINAARVLMCVAKASGMSLQETRRTWGLRWAAFIQGDDTVLGFEEGLIDMTVYEEESLRLGYSTKVIPGVVFLMHLIEPNTGRWTPLASRVFQQTVFNEYGGRHPAVELFSWIARTPQVFWTTNPWAMEVARFVKDGECFQRYRVSPERAILALNNAEFRIDLERELKTTDNVEARFKGLGRSALSDFVANLLNEQGAAELPNVSRDEARSAARSLAGFMSVPEDERRTKRPDLSAYPSLHAYAMTIF